MNGRTHSIAERSGYTLIELLVVVAIIGMLAALSIVVMTGITTQAEEEATKATLAKINRLLEARIEAFDRAFKGGRRDDYVIGTIQLLKAIDSRFDYYELHPEESPPAISMLAYKAGFRFEVPQRMVDRAASGEDQNTNGTLDTGEDLNGNGVLDGPDNVPAPTTFLIVPGMPGSVYLKVAYPFARRQLIQEALPTVVTPTKDEIDARVTENWAKHVAWETSAAGSDADTINSTESSELLYFMLTQSGNFGTTLAAADQFTESEVADVDEDGLLEFVDAWGQPFQFYRWPTRLFDPDAPNPFKPEFATLNDNTEVDPSPLDDDLDPTTIEDTDALREIMPWEREYAGLLVKGLPPTPIAIGNTTQRDMMLVDPNDPVGILYTFLEDPQYTSLGIDLTDEYNESKYHTPDTYHAPLIVSGGPDERLGLRAPNDVDDTNGIFGNLAQYAETTVSNNGVPDTERPSDAVVDLLFDNLTNRNRRVGARR